MRGETRRPDARGQLSLPVVEAAVGVLLVLGISLAFGVGVPGPERERAQLERYAEDAGRTLTEEPAAERGPLLTRALATEEAFEAHSDGLYRRLRALLPAAVGVRLETPHGSVGPPRPPGVATGRARVPTIEGVAAVEVWYA